MTQPVITLTQGLLGLEAFTKFRPSPSTKEPLLHAAVHRSSEQLSFIVMEPALLVADYAFELSDDDVPS